jgi:hypothetical protein
MPSREDMKSWAAQSLRNTEVLKTVNGCRDLPWEKA